MIDNPFFDCAVRPMSNVEAYSFVQATIKFEANEAVHNGIARDYTQVYDELWANYARAMQKRDGQTANIFRKATYKRLNGELGADVGGYWIELIKQGEHLNAILWIVFVDEKWRRCGFGSALVNDAISQASERYCSTIRLQVAPANTTAKRLYEKMGLTPIAISMQRSL